MRTGEVQALGKIAAGVVARPSFVARDVHRAVTERVFRGLGPLGIPSRFVHDAVSGASYRAVATALQAPLNAAGRLLADAAATPRSPALGDSVAGSLSLAALNGIFGDRLAANYPELALELTIRKGGKDVRLDADGIADAFPAATPKLAVFVHGLCETDDAWRLSPAGDQRPSYGSRLRKDLGFTPLYVRYNSGLHISDNGRRLADALERLVGDWPIPVEEIALVGHSMGGLVSRSACRYGEHEGHAWTTDLRHVFCLGTPHLGAPLEKLANLAGWPLNQLPETRPFGDLFINGRSAGIKDLRFGSCVEEDWCDCDPDEFLRDRCNEVPFLSTASYYFVGATLSRRQNGVGALVGDLLVRFPSASGQGRRRRIPFEVDNGRHLGGINHLQLLNHPSVYTQIRDWLQRGSVQAGRVTPAGRPQG
jgi:pimeloyl-ACP methyl ester carboxylesterase